MTHSLANRVKNEERLVKNVVENSLLQSGLLLASLIALVLIAAGVVIYSR
ncbi:MAG TPA: hypothetical protein VFQ79_01885 [Bryobacteraceae bacterium]|nr:hypothetical protein [Bryobacteraceae bacterium]